MDRNAEDLLREALHLPVEARAALAGSLIESLDSDVDPDAEAAWGSVISRRLQEIESGLVHCVPWPEARRNILASMGNGPAR